MAKVSSFILPSLESIRKLGNLISMFATKLCIINVSSPLNIFLNLLIFLGISLRTIKCINCLTSFNLILYSKKLFETISDKYTLEAF